MSTDNQDSEQSRPRWLVALLIATTFLIIMAVGAYAFYGRELFQRPFLIIAFVIAWLGTLVGLAIARDPNLR